MADDEVFADLDPLLASADVTRSPWTGAGSFDADLDFLGRLLAIPIEQGRARKQSSGRVAKSVDAWIAHELRRSGFPGGAVWPRARRPRVLPADVEAVEEAVERALARVDVFEDRLTRYAAAAEKKGLKAKPPSLKDIRSAIRRVGSTGKGNALPGFSEATILGRFYVKQVDVAVSSWQHGPDVMISTKTQFSSYLNNKNNRYEEAVGEATNLRDRHPMAAMGFAYVVRSNIFDEEFAYAYLRDLLVRLRRPDGPFDATMLLAASWDDPWDGVKKEERDDTLFPTFHDVEETVPTLSSGKFFEDLLDAVTSNTPVDRHTGVRQKMPTEQIPGGLPPEDVALLSDEEVAERAEHDA